MTTPTEALARAIATQDQLREFIGKHGQEDTATFLLMEADAAISALRAALAAPPAAPPVPAGMVLVPVEPTPAMLEAVAPFPEHLRAEHPDPADPWHRSMGAAVIADRMYASQQYRYMLAAAPAAQPVPATGAQPEARTRAEWHDDDGCVQWWAFPINEPPYVGSPLCDNWPGYHTHWTPIVCPTAPTGSAT